MSKHHKQEHDNHTLCQVCNQCKDCSGCRCTGLQDTQGSPLRKMMIVVSKAGIDSVYAGLIMANGARSEGIEVDMFFTFFGLDVITKKRMEHLKIALAGNPGMHMPEIVGVFPGMENLATHMMMKRMDELDIPHVGEFLDIIKAAGGTIFACKLAMEMFNLSEQDLYEDIDGVLTVGQFYERYNPGTQIIFI
ncbi:DsrE/DsrF/DrsH-like family protein [Candidatus Saccharibacteria bacterium]|nr:DsrE/DsrF/DrsH-like family protein [Candidatus Saccharibacteria bacterium]MCB9821072.1 DsrE/DsrF/DrsH-like family protein [Candidatus Nomurabacteria bacterium]